MFCHSREAIHHRSHMTEVTRNSAMVREPNTIHTATDESSSSASHLASSVAAISEHQDNIMPDLSETKLRNSRSNNRSGDLHHSKHAGHSSGDETAHDEEDKHNESEEVSAFFMLNFSLKG